MRNEELPQKPRTTDVTRKATRWKWAGHIVRLWNVIWTRKFNGDKDLASAVEDDHQHRLGCMEKIEEVYVQQWTQEPGW